MSAVNLFFHSEELGMVGKGTPEIIIDVTLLGHTLSFKNWDKSKIKRWVSKKDRATAWNIHISVMWSNGWNLWLVGPRDKSMSRLHTHWRQLALLQPSKRPWAFSPSSPWPLTILVPRYLFSISGSLRTDISLFDVTVQCWIEKTKKCLLLAKKPFVLSLPAWFPLKRLGLGLTVIFPGRSRP